MRTLQTHDRPTPLARALEELGRIIKTLYMLRYIDDEAYRRRILTQPLIIRAPGALPNKARR